MHFGPVSLQGSHISQDSEIDVQMENAFLSVTKINRPNNKPVIPFLQPILSIKSTCGDRLSELSAVTLSIGVGQGAGDKHTVQICADLRLKLPRISVRKIN